MGMGEPLDNLENVIKTVKMINDPKGLNLSQRRISISTVGLIDKINILLQKDLKVNLVLSLHAPNQQLREELIPYAKNNNLEDLLKVMAKYAEKTSRDITFEYILIEGINDSEKEAFQLAEKLKGFQHFSVNLIPYNPIDQIISIDQISSFDTVINKKIMHQKMISKKLVAESKDHKNIEFISNTESINNRKDGHRNKNLKGQAGKDGFSFLDFKRPEKIRIKRFKDILLKKKIPVTQRYEKGSEIAAACGQLALRT